MLRSIGRRRPALLAALAVCLLPALGGTGACSLPVGDVLITGCCPTDIRLPILLGLSGLLVAAAIFRRSGTVRR